MAKPSLASQRSQIDDLINQTLKKEKGSRREKDNYSVFATPDDIFMNITNKYIRRKDVVKIIKQLYKCQSRMNKADKDFVKYCLEDISTKIYISSNYKKILNRLDDAWATISFTTEEFIDFRKYHKYFFIDFKLYSNIDSEGTVEGSIDDIKIDTNMKEYEIFSYFEMCNERVKKWFSYYDQSFYHNDVLKSGILNINYTGKSDFRDGYSNSDYESYDLDDLDELDELDNSKEELDKQSIHMKEIKEELDEFDEEEKNDKESDIEN